MPTDLDHKIARKGRVVSLTIAGAMLTWLAAQFIGPAIGLSTRVAVLIDLIALAAFVWAFVGIHDIWRMRRNQG